MYYVAVPLLLLVALAQSAVLPAFATPWLRPDLVLVLLAAWAVARSPEELMVLAPLGGVWLDLLGPAPVGVSVLALAPVVLLGFLTELGIVSSDLLMAVFVTVAGTVLFYLIQAAVLDLSGYSLASLDALRAALLPGVLVNAAVTPVLYFPLRATRSGARSTLRSTPRF
ncbi:MAG TPA: rod shape-determining protein MreD [Dehalococcoidia bacterium]